jgi:vancomycin resistance protein YoaR
VRVQRGALAFVVLAVTGSALGLVFAGSPGRIAAGVRIDGVNVGGMTPGAAQRVLERRAQSLDHVPVVFFAGRRRWRVTPEQLGVRADWHAAVELARRHGDGFGPFRGFRRIGVRVFGAEFAPPTRVYESAMAFKIDRFARALYRPHRDPQLRLYGLAPAVIAGSEGRSLDRAAAAHVVVAALAGFARRPVALPVRSEPTALSAAQLAVAAARVRVALSAPVRMQWGSTVFTITPWQLRAMLDLPHPGVPTLRIGGPGAERYFVGLRRALERRARNAGFAISPGGAVSVIPSAEGRRLDTPATARNLLAAALSHSNRTARVVVTTVPPGRTTREARAFGVRGLVGSYETIYGGDANRIHNVQLVARLLDGRLIAPGGTFSFNRATGARTAEKGFREAPVIINGELGTGLGGGVCQVSTTVFNAAYEAGLQITSRTNHALYISHYPLGRDATVDYPDIDLRFVNDTPHWLLLRTFVGSYSLTVGLYGAPQHRRVVTETRPLVETGAPPVKQEPDASLTEGQTVAVDGGEPSRSTSVRRRVYSNGKLLYDDTWYSTYRAEPKLVLVGTKPKPEPVKKKKKKPPPTTTTTTTTTTPTTTTSAQ